MVSDKSTSKKTIKKLFVHKKGKTLHIKDGDLPKEASKRRRQVSTDLNWTNKERGITWIWMSFVWQ